MSTTMLKTTAPMKEELARKGFTHLKARDLLIPDKLERAFKHFKEESLDLPLDQYAPDRTRYRRHSRFVQLPWDGYLTHRPVHGYYQDKALNPVNGGVVRKFADLSPTMRQNEFLLQLIQFDLEHLPFAENDLQYPLDVGVHVIKIVARPGKPGVSSPNCLHKDGEPYTAIHLLSREDITGGESLVADNTKRSLFEVTLQDTLDSLIVRDSDVYHHVNPINVLPDREEGFRVVLLIDFTPMKPIVQVFP